MATYKLIPSSWGGASSITNPSNAYADTTSTTYAEAAIGTQTPACLGGFGFSTIPQGSTITGLTVKVKAAGSPFPTTSSVKLVQSDEVLSGSLSDSQTLARTETVYTLNLTSSVDTILEYKDTLCLCFTGSGTTDVYGAEIIVDVTLPSRNKIIYGNETLIDLTSDTATEADVASGKTFHLASGKQATGVFSPPTLSKATATTTGTSTREVSFTVSKEPSWFMMICSSTNTASRSDRVQHILYNGTTTTTYYGNGSTAGTITTSTSYGSFSYSSGTLTITVKIAPYFGKADWALYYL